MTFASPKIILAGRLLLGLQRITCYARSRRSEDDPACEGSDQPAKLMSMPGSPSADDSSSDEAALRRWKQAQLYEADLRKASAASSPKMRNRFSTRCLKVLVVSKQYPSKQLLLPVTSPRTVRGSTLPQRQARMRMLVCTGGRARDWQDDLHPEPGVRVWA